MLPAATPPEKEIYSDNSLQNLLSHHSGGSVVEGMTTRRRSTPHRPGDVPSAHPRAAQDAGAADPSQREAPAPARAAPPAALRPAGPSGSTPPSSCSSPRRSCEASRRRHPLRRPHRTARPRETTVATMPPRRRATAASRCRRACPARRSSMTSRPNRRTCPDCGTERTCIGEESASSSNTSPPSSDRGRARPAQIRLPGLRGQRRDRRAAPRADREGPARPGAVGLRHRQQVCRSLAALSPRGDLPPVQGVELSRQTMCDWMAVAAELLEPIVKLMLSEILQLQGRSERRHDGAGAGPRPARGQDRPALGLHRRSRPSLYGLYLHAGPQCRRDRRRSSRDSRAISRPTPIRPTTACTPRATIVEVGCMMHARRKFHEARTSDPQRSHQALAWISLLYDVERREGARDRRLRGVRRLAAPGARRAIAADLRQVPCLAERPNSPRSCPRARSAKRSGMR